MPRNWKTLFSNLHTSVADTSPSRNQFLDGTLTDGSRAQVTYGTEVTPKGSTFTIRKFKKTPLTITDLIIYKALSAEIAAYYWFLIENRHSVMIGGDIGGGKTSMLNAISLFIRPTLKIVSIEDTQEIRLPHQNWEMMVTRQGLGTGAGAVGEAGIGSISMFDLLRAALRQRPDFIIVGEIRGEEAYALFQAMATGHLGLTTIHAEHVQGVLHRLTTRPMNIPQTQVENLNAISIVRRLVVNNVSLRRTISVSEMCGWDTEKGDFKIQDIFKWDVEKDIYIKTSKKPTAGQNSIPMGILTRRNRSRTCNETNDPRIHGQETHTLLRRRLKDGSRLLL